MSTKHQKLQKFQVFTNVGRFVFHCHSLREANAQMRGFCAHTKWGRQVESGWIMQPCPTR